MVALTCHLVRIDTTVIGIGYFPKCQQFSFVYFMLVAICWVAFRKKISWRSLLHPGSEFECCLDVYLSVKL